MIRTLYGSPMLKLIKRAIKTSLGVILRPLLAGLGYAKNQRGTFPLPPSHYFTSVTLFDQVKGLHGQKHVRSWMESKSFNQSISGGEYVPWITFSATEFLKSLPLSKMKILEVGSGASTFWFCKFSKELISYEFDREYYRILKNSLQQKNFTLILAENFITGSSTQNIDVETQEALSHDKKWCDLDSFFWERFNPSHFMIDFKESLQDADLVFVDGGLRTFCLQLILKNVKSDSIVVVDNSDAEWVREGIVKLLKNGFIEIPFIGMGPLNPYQWQTSILLKDLSCLRKLQQLPNRPKASTSKLV